MTDHDGKTLRCAIYTRKSIGYADEHEFSAPDPDMPVKADNWSRPAADRPDQCRNAGNHGREGDERKRIEDEHAVLLTCVARCARDPARFQIGEHLLHRARPRLAAMSEFEYERRIANGGTTEARGALPTLA